MNRNFRVEADIKEACQDAGVLESAYDDVVAHFYNYDFDGTPSSIRAYLERCRTERPHIYAVQGDDMEQAALEAFGPHGTSLQRRAEYVRRYGQEAAENAARAFGTTVASTKPGILPQHMAEKVKVQAPRGDNPWSAVDDRGFPTTDARGRFLPAQITKQTNLVRTLVRAHGNVEGTRRAEAIARAAGCRLGSTAPPKVA